MTPVFQRFELAYERVRELTRHGGTIAAAFICRGYVTF